MNPDAQGGPNFPGEHMLWDMIRQERIDYFGTVSLMARLPDFVEEKDMNMMTKYSKTLTRDIVFSVFGGFFLNLQLKRIPGFLETNRLVRYIARIPVFFAPFGLFYKDFYGFGNDFNGMVGKYQDRLFKFQRTGNFRYMDPSGDLTRKMNKKMGM